jgi:nicotinamidase-related amidase
MKDLIVVDMQKGFINEKNEFLIEKNQLAFEK